MPAMPSEAGGVTSSPGSTLPLASPGWVDQSPTTWLAAVNVPVPLTLKACALTSAGLAGSLPLQCMAPLELALPLGSGVVSVKDQVPLRGLGFDLAGLASAGVTAAAAIATR